MKSILLTTTAIVAFAGAAAADGHVTMTWSGAATAGIARDGGSAAGAVNATLSEINENAAGAVVAADLEADQIALLNAVQTQIDSGDLDTAIGDALVDAGTEKGAPLTAAEEIEVVATAMRAHLKQAAVEAAALGQTANVTAIAGVNALIDATVGTAEVATGDFDTYAEVNATVTGSVAMSNGVTVTAAMSVDAGTGYDFADDDGFDAAKTNGVALDFVTIDAGAMGALTLDKNDIAHLVDGDDDATGDIKYTNDLGIATVEVVMDLATDTDVVARKTAFEDYAAAAAAGAGEVQADLNAAVIADYDFATTDGGTQGIGYNAAVAADVAWSAKVSAPVADIATVYAAFDEEGGNAFGGSATIEGVTITVDSALEALAEELGEARSNTIGASYTAAGLTVGGAYNTVKDGNQWSINAAYAADGFSVAYSTNEGEEWSATASYELSENASIEAGVNYTEDAFVGVAFNF